MAKLWQIMKDRRGQSLVEFALILPIFLLLVFGIIEYGRIISSQMIVSNAARGGARIAAVSEIADADLKAKVVGMYSFINIQDDDIVIVYNPNPRNSGGSVKVRVSYDVNIYAPVISMITGNPFTVTAETTMYVE